MTNDEAREFAEVLLISANDPPPNVVVWLDSDVREVPAT